MLAAIPGNSGHAQEAPPGGRLPSSSPADVRLVADPAGCDAKPLGQITVATLNNAPFVTLSANGRPVILLLDTGAEQSVLTPAAAERIGARAPQVEFDTQMRGAAGTLSTREVELRSFSAGEVSIPWRRLLVAPVTVPTPLGIDLDGLLGADVLSSFDVDLDLPRHRMALYRKRSCPDAPPWRAPYTAIETGRSSGEHLFFPAQLDGRRVVAFVDTGSQKTLLTEETALALGVTRAALAQGRPVTTKDATGKLLDSHVHRFARLTVGSEVIKNPEFVVTDVDVEDADIILGIDFLQTRRIWLSYESLRIFLSTR